jgi:hypothetical protein
VRRGRSGIPRRRKIRSVVGLNSDVVLRFVVERKLTYAVSSIRIHRCSPSSTSWATSLPPPLLQLPPPPRPSSPQLQQRTISLRTSSVPPPLPRLLLLNNNHQQPLPAHQDQQWTTSWVSSAPPTRPLPLPLLSHHRYSLNSSPPLPSSNSNSNPERLLLHRLAPLRRIRPTRRTGLR